MSYRWIFFDTETTGTYPDKDRIIELAAYDPLHNRTFEELIHPGMPIPKEATAIHQITDAMVRNALSFGEVAKKFIEFCHGKVAIVAHNGDMFDLPFMRAEMKRAGLEMPADWIFIDSLKWARRYRKDLPRHALQYLRQMYGIKENQAHRAMNDVMVLYDVFSAMIDDLTPEQVIKLLGKSGWPQEKTLEVPPAPTLQKPKQSESLLLFS